MGFRSTFISEDISGSFTEEFVDKWKKEINFIGDNQLPISTKFEVSLAQHPYVELLKDIQSNLTFPKPNGMIVIIILHECGGVARVEISKESIRFSEPLSWGEVDGVTHNYCYGCSDLSQKEVPK